MVALFCVAVYGCLALMTATVIECLARYCSQIPVPGARPANYEIACRFPQTNQVLSSSRFQVKELENVNFTCVIC
mgnify:FL=1